MVQVWSFENNACCYHIFVFCQLCFQLLLLAQLDGLLALLRKVRYAKVLKKGYKNTRNTKRTETCK